MCLGIPGQILEISPDHPDVAKVDVSGVRRAINVGLLADDAPAPGDWILIHVGFALSKIDEAEARAALEFLEGIGQAYADEMAALAESMVEQDRVEQDRVEQRAADGSEEVGTHAFRR